MQLNNITTGQVITLVSSNETGISYDIYENAIYRDKGINAKRCSTSKVIDKDIIPAIPLSVNLLTEQESLDILIQELEGFTYNSDVQNWKFNDRLLRVLIPNELFNSSLAKQDNLGQLLLVMIPTVKDFTITSEHCVLVYLEELLPEHRYILEQYSDIVIDNKL